MMNKVKKTRAPRKVVDETTQVRCALGSGIIREEVWQDSRFQKHLLGALTWALGR